MMNEEACGVDLQTPSIEKPEVKAPSTPKVLSYQISQTERAAQAESESCSECGFKQKGYILQHNISCSKFHVPPLY